jgi:MSHA biogenesis protein MshQ
LTDGNYLGAGVVNGVQSEDVGRFYPSRFDLIAGNVSNSCTAGNFTYLSDPSITTSYQIAARNINGNTVANYDNATLNYNTANVSVHGEDNNDGVDRSGRMTIATGTWDDGVLAVTSSSASVNRLVDGSLNVVPDGPFSNFVISLGLNDVDGATFSTFDAKPNDTNNCVVDGDCSTRLLSGNLDLRFGRMRVEDAHGPESADIPMQWYMEYWNGSGFVLNTDDHCTQLPISALTFVGASSAVDNVNDIITVTSGGISSAFDFGDSIGNSNCMSASAIGFCDGRAGTAFGATGSIISYPIYFNLIGLDFLQGDWNQDGSYDDTTHPRVNINFQHYRGNDRVIYWRERLQ